MKKKLISITIAIGLTSFVQANTLYCPFNDNFQIAAPPSVKLRDININPQDPHQNLSWFINSDTNFSLKQDDCRTIYGGSMIVKVGYNDQEFCNLIITDGPYEHASVSAAVCTTDRLVYDSIDMPSNNNYVIHLQ